MILRLPTHTLLALALLASLAGCVATPLPTPLRPSLARCGIGEQVADEAADARLLAGPLDADAPQEAFPQPHLGGPLDPEPSDAEIAAALPADAASLAVIELGHEGGELLAAPLGDQALAPFARAYAEAGAPQTVTTLTREQLPRAVSARRLRAAAARAGVSQLLVLTRLRQRREYNNNWSASYWIVVGLLLAPGTTLETDAAAEAAILDVRTGRLLTTVTATATRRERLWLLESHRRARIRLTAEADQELLEQLANKLAP